MGWFKRKEEKIDYTAKCREIYHDTNKIMAKAKNEGDLDIRLSLLQLVSTKYQDILALIDQGADFDRAHFESLKQNVDKEIILYKGL